MLLPSRARPGFVGRAAPPWEVVPDPGALTAWCREHAQAVPGLPVWVEDGFATRGDASRADGWDRRSYIRAQVRALQPDVLEADASGTEPQIAGYLYHAPEGGGDPTWPDADFGLGGDAPGLRRLVEARR